MSFSEHSEPALTAEILRLTRLRTTLAHEANRPAAQRESAFVPGVTPVPYAARVFDADEVEAAVKSSLDFWLTLGVEGEAMERELAAYLNVKRSLLVNSGSSANLLAIAALTSAKLPAAKRVRPGDEVITCAAGFPTTVTPIVQHGCVPVFIDNDPVTGNARVEQLEDAYVPGRTKAVMMAHALGNPFDLTAVTTFCHAHDLYLIEDNCDALGSRYAFAGQAAQATGTFGDLSTQSFYPPHHLTMGEGGAVNIARDMRFKVIVESFRDWGRDCWCGSGVDNTCGKRFGWQLGELPEGYDHKYIYSHLGYNLKPLDLQAAIGRVQLRRLAAFGEARRRNWQRLRTGLAGLQDYFEFSLPTHAKSWNGAGFDWAQGPGGPQADPSWFGFMLLVKDDAPFTAAQLTRHLDEKKIGSRRLFGGNLVRQPAFVQLRRDNPGAFRTVGDLRGADRLMRSALFVGVYPGLTAPMIDYVVETVGEFCRVAAKGRISPP
jgi:CDP-6-deoxy-D-xylo-4-hexulose-3-dehydrase